MNGSGLLLRWVSTWLISVVMFGMAGCSLTNAKAPTATREDTISNHPTNLYAGGGQLEAGSLTVFAAASLRDAFQEIGMKFESVNPGVKVIFSFAGSQVLRTQIEQGAGVDIFASADQSNMDQLITENLVDASSMRVFASNRLIVIVPEENHAGIERLQDLARPGTKVVIADALVPAGNYARQVLSNLREAPEFGAVFYDAFMENVVSNETDVRQVATKVELGEADAGIVYASDAVVAMHIKTIDIPERFNIVAEYPIGRLTSSQHPEIASAFIDFVNSASGQETLSKWGFMPGK